MTVFEEFSSNTYAAAGNQLFFDADPTVLRVGRVFFKIAQAGTFRYSLFFTNTIDSTYADGAFCHHDLPCGTWEIVKAAVACCKNVTMDAAVNETVEGFLPLTFDKSVSKTVAPRECFHSDPLPLTFEENDYLCLELCYRGTHMPYHEESLLPIFAKTNDSWVYDRHMPLPAMIGCDRPVKARIGYIGDSITQGVGTSPNSYSHWNALLSQALGSDYAYWNLGIGYGRASDMAAGGIWFEKAQQNDVLFVCYGVNDLLQGATAEQLIHDLKSIVTRLKTMKKTVILQTVPPFDYDTETTQRWHAVNKFIRDELAQTVDFCFDSVPILGKDIHEPHVARYGGHPNEEGCAAWAKALFEALHHAFLR